MWWSGQIWVQHQAECQVNGQAVRPHRLLQSAAQNIMASGRGDIPGKQDLRYGRVKLWDKWLSCTDNRSFFLLFICLFIYTVMCPFPSFQYLSPARRPASWVHYHLQLEYNDTISAMMRTWMALCIPHLLTWLSTSCGRNLLSHRTGSGKLRCSPVYPYFLTHVVLNWLPEQNDPCISCV